MNEKKTNYQTLTNLIAVAISDIRAISPNKVKVYYSGLIALFTSALLNNGVSFLGIINTTLHPVL